MKEKTVTGVLDNARNIKAWELMDRPIVNCFAHTLNLAVKKGLAIDGIDDTLKRAARKLVSHFHHSAPQVEALKSNQDTLNIPIKDAETKWNSTYDMIVSILENDEALAAVLKTDTKYRQLTLTPEELTILEEVKEVLQLCKDLTVTLSSEKDVTVSLIVPSLIRLTGMFLLEKEGDLDLVKRMKEAMRVDFKTRYNGISTKLLLNVSYFLDPRLKHLKFVPDDEKNEVYDERRQRILRCQKYEQPPLNIKQENTETLPTLSSLDGSAHCSTTEMAVPKMELSPSSPPSKKKKTDFQDIFWDLLVTKVENAPSEIDRIEKEIKLYKDFDPVDLNDNVLKWWQTNESKFPFMAKVAREVLCIPATSTPSEIAFSKAGTLLSVRRAYLKPHKVDMILFLNKNLKLF